MKNQPNPARRRLLVPAAMLYAIGILEGLEVLRQRRHGVDRSLIGSASDRDPASVRALALTWWPAGIAALGEAAAFPQFSLGQRHNRSFLAGGLVVTAGGIALRQRAIATLGRFFVGHVVVQPGQEVVTSGPYRWVRHPSYTGQWLEMVGVGLATGNVLSLVTAALVPLVGITRRIAGEERELTENLPGYPEYIEGKAKLIPGIW